MSLHHDENKDLEYENSWATMLETFGILCMWYLVFYYLRIFDSMNHLTRMMAEVVKDMGVFLLIFVLSHIAFGEVFFFVSKSSA
jgi:hypothetical protein